MTLTLVSLLGSNIDEACVDLSAALRASGVDVGFEPQPWPERLDMVTSGTADLVWLCGKLAVDLLGSGADLTPVAAPEFVPGTGARYSSVVVASRPVSGLAQLCEEGVVWAANEPASWSGHHALLVELDRRGLPAPDRFRWSGSHTESIRLIEAGDADCAAIDRSVWEWIGADSPVVVDETRSWPSPPLCASTPAMAREPGLTQALIDAGATLRNVERLLAVSGEHLDPIATAARSG